MIGLLVPCYNASSYLPEFFESARAQTTPFVEVICCDDGSNDDTAQIAEAFGARVIRNSTNRGAAFSRNRLLETSRADWIHFHDADDLLHPKFVERMSRQASYWNMPVLCAMNALDRNTRERIGVVSYEALNDPSTDPVEFFLDNAGYAIVGVYPTATLKSIGGFRGNLRGNEDPDLHVRMALSGVKFRAESSVLVTNLMHNGSWSSKNWRQCLVDRLICFETYEGVVSNTPKGALGRQALKLAQALHAHDAFSEAKRSSRLAVRCGVKHLDSHRWTTRIGSQIIGVDRAVRLRNFIYRIRGRLRA